MVCKGKALTQPFIFPMKNNIKNFDLKTFASNITLEGATDFVQKYGTAALTTIINKQPVTSQTMLDGLFNGFAPALDMTAVQMGYNSVVEMKNAVQAGNINVTNFIHGFDGALSTVINNKKKAIDYGSMDNSNYLVCNPWRICRCSK